MHDDVTFVSGHTRIFAIVGHPIEQVGSPAMFTGEFLRRKVDAILIPLHVLPDDFEATVRQLLRMPNLGGLVFTIPFKQRAVAFADHVGAQGRAAGAINGLARRADGWHGEMFDGLGCVEAFRRHGVSLAGKRLQLVGAGGAGSAIGVAMAFESPASIRVTDVDASRAVQLAARIRSANPGVDASTGPARLDDIDVLLNASPVGMLADARMPVDASAVDPRVIVFDAIVKPETTPLLAVAKERGCQVIYGSEMMRGQMARIVSFFGYPEA
jgi:shikimate dehydrogenase